MTDSLHLHRTVEPFTACLISYQARSRYGKTPGGAGAVLPGTAHLTQAASSRSEATAMHRVTLVCLGWPFYPGGNIPRRIRHCSTVRHWLRHSTRQRLARTPCAQRTSHSPGPKLKITDNRLHNLGGSLRDPWCPRYVVIVFLAQVHAGDRPNAGSERFRMCHF